MLESMLTRSIRGRSYGELDLLFEHKVRMAIQGYQSRSIPCFHHDVQELEGEKSRVVSNNAQMYSTGPGLRSHPKR